jgi:hypothetical protein
MGDFERGLIQGEAMRHQIEKTNIDLLAENAKLRAALQTVVDLAEDGILPDGHDLKNFRTLLNPSS